MATNKGGKRQQKPSFINRDVIMHKDEFYKLPKADRRALMSHWRMTHTTEAIKKEMGISATGLYRLLNRLDLPTNLKAHRDIQPSLLGEVDKPKVVNPTNPMNMEMASELTADPSGQQVKQTTEPSMTCKVNLQGDVDIYMLPELIALANKLGLALDIKNQF